VVIGARDSQEALSNAGAYDPGSSGAAVHPWSARFDPEVVAIATGVALDGWGGHWLHVDLDVLSTTTMPAVDYPQPGGLTWEDLAVVLRPAFGDARLLGMSVADLNPTLDVDGRAAEATVELLVSLQAGL
jgi:arginase